MRTIALEEHFATRALLDGPGRQVNTDYQSMLKFLHKLTDIGDGRIADMDAAGIDVQVLSLTSPGVEQPDAAEAVELARDANDRLAERYAAIRTGLSGWLLCQPRLRKQPLRSWSVWSGTRLQGGRDQWPHPGPLPGR